MERSGNVLRHGIGFLRYCATTFGAMRHFSAPRDFFEKIFLDFFPVPPRRYLLRRGLIMTPAGVHTACSYCCDLILCEKILWYCFEIGFSSVMYQDRV